MSGRWVDLREAAELLDTSTEAVRKRAARGSLRSDRQNGRVLVWVDEGRTEGGREAQVDREALVESLQDQVAYLREIVATRDEEIRRRDVIISQLTSRIPEIEATPAPGPDTSEPSDAPGGSQERREEAGREKPRAEGSEGSGGRTERPWWRRVFG